MRAVVDLYLADLATRARRASVAEAVRGLELVLAGLSVAWVDELTAPMLLRWRAARVAGGAANKTANTEVGYLKAALSFAVRMGEIPRHPLAGLRGLPVGGRHQRRRPRALSDWEVRRLFAAAEELDREGLGSESRSRKGVGEEGALIAGRRNGQPGQTDCPERTARAASAGSAVQHSARTAGDNPCNPCNPTRKCGPGRGSTPSGPESAHATEPARVKSAQGARREARKENQPRKEDHRRGTIPQAPLVRALALTGARFGELVAATWSDLDMQRGTLTLREETTKTERGRTLPLDVDLAEDLARLPERILLRTGVAPSPGSPIFLSPKGKPWVRGRANFWRYLQRVFELAGIPHKDESGRVVHVHALRHTFATRLARAGVPLATAQLLTGHRSATVLLSVYTHLVTDEAREALESLPRIGVGSDVPAISDPDPLGRQPSQRALD